MEADLVQGKLGTVGKYDVAFKGGELVVEIDGNDAVGSVGMVVKVKASAVLDAIALAIPGTIDDALIGIIKGALSA